MEEMTPVTESDLAAAFEGIEAEPLEEEAPAAESAEPQEPQEEAEEQEETEDSEEDEAAVEPEALPDPAARYKVLVKDANGQIVEEKVDFKELREGYQKGREVDSVRAEAEQAVSQTRVKATEAIEQARSHFSTELASLHALVNQALDIVSPEQLMSLASTDRDAYNIAIQKQQVFQNIRARLSETLTREQQQQQQHQHDLMQKQISDRREKALNALSKEGLTSKAVQKIYDEAGPLYGFAPEELSPNLDHRLVLLLKDAAELKRLKAKTTEVAKTVRAAPKLPVKTSPQAKPKARPTDREGLAAAWMNF